MIDTTKKVAAVLGLVVAVSACDVTNPGPVQDEFLALPAAQQGLVNGAIRNISELTGDAGYSHALLAREIFPGGQTGAWGNGVSVQGGHILPGSFAGAFNDAQQARFIAETAIKRFTDAGAPDMMMYQAHLWAGYAYRVMGELWCDAVVASTDPDDPEPGVFETGTQTYFQRAADNFTAALTYAATPEEEDAAYAGRAQAYVWLEQWSNAASDASQVPDDFEFTAVMDDSESALYNDFYEATSGQFRSYTVQFTWFEDYYSDGGGTPGLETNSGDPRTIWVIDPDFTVATASLQDFGAVPYKPQRKYTTRNDDIRLASGWEMRLIQAEAALAQGQGFAAAEPFINARRGAGGLISDIDGTSTLQPWPMTSDAEAWTALKRERAIELWLEGRRTGDERRWAAAGTPGSLDTPNWEDPSHPGYTPLFTTNPRSFCFDIPESERDRNPNVPAIGG